MVKMRKDEKANTLVKTYERGFPVGFKASLEVGRRRGSGASCSGLLGEGRKATRHAWQSTPLLLPRHCQALVLIPVLFHPLLQQ